MAALRGAQDDARSGAAGARLPSAPFEAKPTPNGGLDDGDGPRRATLRGLENRLCIGTVAVNDLRDPVLVHLEDVGRDHDTSSLTRALRLIHRDQQPSHLLPLCTPHTASRPRPRAGDAIAESFIHHCVAKRCRGNSPHTLMCAPASPQTRPSVDWMEGACPRVCHAPAAGARGLYNNHARHPCPAPAPHAHWRTVLCRAMYKARGHVGRGPQRAA